MATKKIKLAKIYRPLEKMTIHLSLSGELGQEMDQYRAYYKKVYGDEIETKELIESALAAFLAGDVEFQKEKRTGQLKVQREVRKEEEHIVANGHDKKRAVKAGIESEESHTVPNLS